MFKPFKNYLILLFLLLVIFTSCNNADAIKVVGISLSKTTLDLHIGEAETIIATISPVNATNKKLNYTSSNTNIATVDSCGKVMAKSFGTTDVKVEAKGGAFAVCRLNVIPFYVEGITLNKSSLYLGVGEKEILTASIAPDNATNKNIVWNSSNTDVATVNESGEVLARAVGNSKITATTEDGNFVSTCDVSVVVKVTSLSLNKTLLEMEVGDEEILIATIIPENTNKNIIWTIDDENIATIDNTGKVVAKSLGETVVTATTEDGSFSATCHIKVVIKVKSIILNKESLSFEVGETETLFATITPDNATNKNIIWASNDENIAMVDNKGQIKGKSAGNTIITATTEDGNYSAACEVEVIEYPYLKLESSRRFCLDSPGERELYCSGPSGKWYQWSGNRTTYLRDRCVYSEFDNASGKYILLVRGLNNKKVEHWGIYWFNGYDFDSIGEFDDKIYCTGDIRSLLNYKDVESTLMDSCCFKELFKGWKCLATSPSLPATTLAESCYASMFSGCTSLTSAPELPATTLATSCYYCMFSGCTSLTSAPALPAETLATSCYYYMFSGCTSLTSAPELPATTLAESCYKGMFSGCTSLTSAPELPATTLATSCYYCMFSGCTSLTSAPELPATTLATSCYYCMFSGCTSLTSAPALPAETLATSCYYYMFSGCTSLTSAPALPAETLATSCYYYMFSGCTSLTSAPELPATTLAESCYKGMFSGCTSLINALCFPTKQCIYNDNCCEAMFKDCSSITSGPILLPPTSSRLGCYCFRSMFEGCTSLTSAPAIYALNDAKNLGSEYTWEYCASMFKGCTSLTSAPELPATTACGSCYLSMFEGCTSLTSAPELPATTLRPFCYKSMFKGCTSLTSAPELPATALWASCYSSMFEGCTSLTSAPALPATNLPESCYKGMFLGCTSLTSAPELPATTLRASCYKLMFSGCSLLKFSTYKDENEGYINEFRLPATNKDGCMEDMFKDTGGLFTGTPESGQILWTCNEIIK